MMDDLQLPLFERTEADIAWRAYLAGMLDGEGYITVAKFEKGKAFRPKVAIGMCEGAVVHLCYDRYGGHLSHKSKPNPRHRWQWEWNITGKGVIPVLVDVMPFLILKRQQAEIALAIAQTVGRNGGNGRRGLPSAVLSDRVAAYERCRELNRKGVA